MMALLITSAVLNSFLLSRILLWLTKGWHGGYARILAIHMSLIVACLGMLIAKPESYWASTQAVLLYASAQILWLIVDLFAHRGRLETQRGVA